MHCQCLPVSIVVSSISKLSIAALLISIEPLIDMARTALNVSGAMAAGTITSRVLKSTNDEVALEEQKA